MMFSSEEEMGMDMPVDFNDEEVSNFADAFTAAVDGEEEGNNAEGQGSLNHHDESDSNSDSDSEEDSEDNSPEGSSLEQEDDDVLFGGESRGNSEEFKWYVAHVLTGHEYRVRKAIRDRIVNMKMQNSFAKIYIPEEAQLKNISGKKRRIKKKFFPGYVLIKMIMNDSTWHLVKNTDKVTGFLGANRMTPLPISDEEAKVLLGNAKDGFKKSKQSINLSEGDSVRVTEGPFATFVGVVEYVNEKGKIRVQVSIFGRPTPVELDFSQVERVETQE